MGKILLGCFLLVIGAMVSFIPPFIWGIPIFITAAGMIVAGFGKLGKSAAKGIAAVVSKSDNKPA